MLEIVAFVLSTREPLNNYLKGALQSLIVRATLKELSTNNLISWKAPTWSLF